MTFGSGGNQAGRAGGEGPRVRPRSLLAHVFVRDPDRAIRFYQEGFGAAELFRTTLPDGRVLFVELAVGDGRLLVSEEITELDALAPETVGGSPVLLTLEVDDVDALAGRAVVAGARIVMPVQEMFFGERYGIVLDPAGHRWALVTAREHLTPDQIRQATPPTPT